MDQTRFRNHWIFAGLCGVLLLLLLTVLFLMQEKPLDLSPSVDHDLQTEQRDPDPHSKMPPPDPPVLLIPEMASDYTISGEKVGVLSIPSIQFEMPVIADATPAHLHRGPALMIGSHLPENAGNTVISAHRMYETGRHFNRLDEIRRGDGIHFQREGQLLIYRVEQMTFVDPSELWITLGDTRENRLTLFACMPIRAGTHRLVVFAVLEKQKIMDPAS